MRQQRRSKTGLVSALAGLGLVAVILSACASGSSSPAVASPSAIATSGASIAASPSGATATAAATANPTAAPSGPATLDLTVKGDANVTGAWGASFGISCNNPTFDGLDIIFFAQSPDTKAVVLITLTKTSVGVSERAGAGAAYTDREFQGTGVTTFDPARGATFDTDVSIVPTPDSKPGTLGTITHVAGSIDCGGQTPGTSTIVASGTSPEGSINGPFTAARVTCNSSAANGGSVGVSAVMTTATPPVFLIISLRESHTATIFLISQNPSKQHSYSIDKAGTETITATGGHVDADFVEVLATGVAGSPHTIHLTGDVTCGATTTN